MGAIMHRVEANGLNQLDHSWGRITAIEEVLTEMDNADWLQPVVNHRQRWIMARDELYHEMDHGQIRITIPYGYITGGG